LIKISIKKHQVNHSRVVKAFFIII